MSTFEAETPAPSDAEPEREAARKRVQAKRDFGSHLAAFVVINAALIGVWAITGGYFWPAWIIGLWGAGLIMHAWDVYVRRPVTEADVDDELRRHH